ncbi:MAG TPA: hypothetical protein VIG71_00755 [Enteractinococcus sp.]
MKITITQSKRWLATVGLGVLATFTLTSCGGGPPSLTEISESAKQTMSEASSFTYTRTDPNGVHDDELSLIEWSGQTEQDNHHVTITADQGTLEFLVVDDTTAFLKVESEDGADTELFSLPGAEGQWIQAPESGLEETMGIDDEFASTTDTAFTLIDGLSEEELDTVEVEETELDGQEVYKYTVPATDGSDLYTGSETVAFYFVPETSELIQVEATSGDHTATHSFTDLNEVERFEAPPEDEIADLEWTF